MCLGLKIIDRRCLLSLLILLEEREYLFRVMRQKPVKCCNEY